MKGWYRRGDLRGDVMQEASLRVGEKILRGTLVYEDRGLEKFGAWLWMIWLNACRSAWRHCHPLWLDGMTLCDPQQLARFSFEIRDLSPANELLWIVYERGDRLTQDALLAWLGGLSLRASAKDLGLTKAAVVKLRRQLVGMFRAARRQIDEERGR
jgi:DNA-directed RNA polymerase specialized sigma24 family protein